jgi:hypothetical protein
MVTSLLFGEEKIQSPNSERKSQMNRDDVSEERS